MDTRSWVVWSEHFRHRRTKKCGKETLARRKQLNPKDTEWPPGPTEGNNQTQATEQKVLHTTTWLPDLGFPGSRGHRQEFLEEPVELLLLLLLLHPPAGFTARHPWGIDPAADGPDSADRRWTIVRGVEADHPGDGGVADPAAHLTLGQMTGKKVVVLGTVSGLLERRFGDLPWTVLVTGVVGKPRLN